MLSKLSGENCINESAQIRRNPSWSVTEVIVDETEKKIQQVQKPFYSEGAEACSKAPCDCHTPEPQESLRDGAVEVPRFRTINAAGDHRSRLRPPEMRGLQVLIILRLSGLVPRPSSVYASSHVDNNSGTTAGRLVFIIVNVFRSTYSGGLDLTFIF